MSRIGRLPVTVPSGVEVSIKKTHVQVKGPKGELERTFPSLLVEIKLENGEVIVRRKSEEADARAMHGTTRALIQNMVTGVSEGFTKTLQIEGVGYRPDMSGDNLILHVGFSHPVEVVPVEGISFEVDARLRQIKVHGISKELVGKVASEIRKVRPPEPYKGKGIRYLGEYVRRKAGKAAQAAG